MIELNFAFSAVVSDFTIIAVSKDSRVYEINLVR
jgi:hypothetical protein